MRNKQQEFEGYLKRISLEYDSELRNEYYYYEDTFTDLIARELKNIIKLG